MEMPFHFIFITLVRSKKSAVIRVLEKVCCSCIDQNYWLFDHRCDVTDVLENEFGVDFSFKIMNLRKIKNNFTLSKKRGN